jgi:hypothetical protein
MTRPTYETFMAEHGGLVRSLISAARRGIPAHLREDLDQAAALGVVRGLAEADPESPRPLASQVADVVRTELNAASRPERRRLEREVPADDLPEEDCAVLEERLTDPAPGADDALFQAQCAAALERGVSELHGLTRVIATARFLKDPPETIGALAMRLKTSVWEVRSLEADAREALAGVLPVRPFC